MPKIFAKSTFSFMAVMLLLSIIHIGCSSRHLEQNQQNILEQPQKNAPEQPQIKRPSAKFKETSIFSVIEIEDVEYPTHSVSIHLPFRARPNNTVCLAEKHAYLTTERHLHVIDVSIPQRPSYLTSLEFPDKIGKVLASGDYLVVTSQKKFHIVDVSQPSHPVLESTGHLPQRHPIKDLDVLNDHLYVMGENDHLHIFYAPRGQARLVKVIELEKRWWLLSLKAGSPEVKQIPQWTSNTFPGDLWDPLLSQRRFLQLLSSKQEKVRASSIFLVVEWLRDPTYDLFSFDAYRRVDDPFITVVRVGHHDLAWQFRKYLTETGQKTLTRNIPARAYAVANGKMQEILPEPSNETVDVEDKRLKQLMGPVTDFQISGGRLYIVTANGFFSIIPIIGDHYQDSHYRYQHLYYNREERVKDKWRKLSTGEIRLFLPFLAGRPISLTVSEGEHYAYVLSDPEDSQR